MLAGAQTVAAAESCDAPIHPMELHYRLMDGDRDRGKAIAVLARSSDANWVYRVKSRTRFGIIPISLEESTRFEWHGLRPRPNRYVRSTRGGPFERRSTARFDWASKQSEGRHKGDDWTLPLNGDELDRLSLQLATATALAQGRRDLAFHYIDRGRHRSLEIQPAPVADLATPAGEFETILVERNRGERTTRTYHAVDLDYLPVRVDHEDDDDDYSLVLESYRRLPCSALISELERD